MPRQPFNDFMDSPGFIPFSYNGDSLAFGSSSGSRGRGGGGARGGGGRGFGRGRGGAVSERGGGRGGGGRGRGGGGANYSNVQPVNYDVINRERYNKVDASGFAPSPYDSSARGTPGNITRGGRGTGRGGRGNSLAQANPNHGSTTPAADSGSATPHTGLGFPVTRGSGRGGSFAGNSNNTRGGSRGARGGGGIGTQPGASGRLGYIMNELEEVDRRGLLGLPPATFGGGRRGMGKEKMSVYAGHGVYGGSGGRGGRGGGGYASGLGGAPIFVLGGAILSGPEEEVEVGFEVEVEVEAVNEEPQSVWEEQQTTIVIDHSDEDEDDGDEAMVIGDEPDQSVIIIESDLPPVTIATAIAIADVDVDSTISDAEMEDIDRQLLEPLSTAAINLESEQLLTTLATAIDQVSISASDEYPIAKTRPEELFAMGIDPESGAHADDLVAVAVVDSSSEDEEEEEEEEEEDDEDSPLFFVDTNGGAPGEAIPTEILFDVQEMPTFIGDTTNRSADDDDEDEEEIVFVPRTFAKPEPILLPVSSLHSAVSHGAERPGMDIEQPFISLNPSTANSKRKDKKKALKEKKKNKKMGRKSRREERMKKTEGLPRTGDSDIEWGSDGPPNVSNARGDDDADADADEGMDVAALRDYLQHSLLAPQVLNDSVPEDSDAESEVAKDDDYSIEALAAFAKGMTNARQVTIDEIVEERQAAEEDEEEGWVDSSGSELDDDDEEQAMHAGIGTTVRTAIDLTAEDLMMEEEEEEEEEGDEVIEISDNDNDDDSSANEMNNLKWVGDDSDEDSNDDDDDEGEGDDKMFKGKSSWAVAADEYADELELAGRKKAEAMQGKNRKERRKVFQSVENGDFGDSWPTGPAPQGKKNKMKGVPANLQAQWEADRQKKADKKRERELDRLEAAMSLYAGAGNSKKAKLASKKAAKTTKKGKYRFDGMGGAMSAADMADMFSDLESEGEKEEEEEDEFDADTNRVSRMKRRQGIQPVTDMMSLHGEIQAFILDRGKSTMMLPPMEKFSRKKVHELAVCYGVKSLSKGKGRARFPILTKTSRSSIANVDQTRLNRILNSRGGDFYKAKFGRVGGQGPKPPGGGSGTAGRSGGGGGYEVRHRDGDAVGHGAAAIGEDNIGHRLLSKMGWTEGTRIGMSGGLEAPIVAIVKNSKLGLGA